MDSTPRQLIDQATRHAVHLERLKTHEAREFDAFLRRMSVHLRTEIAGENITDWTLTRLRKQISAIHATLEDEFGDYQATLRDQIMRLGEYEAQFEVRSLSQVARYEFDLPSDAQLRSAIFSRPMQVQGPYQGTLLDPFIEDWSGRQIARVEGAIRIGYAQGRTTPQIVRDLSETLDITRRSMETMTRTALSHTASMAREVTWERNRDIVKKVRWVSTLDARTSTECASLDGQEFPIDSGPRPPAHLNCRSTVVAVLDDRFSILDDGGTRAARDPETGKIERVPAKQTYYQWLKEQPASVQDDILGPTRGTLLRDGGLSAHRFAELQVGKRFEPLTLDQMRRLEPVAFQRAGL